MVLHYWMVCYFMLHHQRKTAENFILMNSNFISVASIPIYQSRSVPVASIGSTTSTRDPSGNVSGNLLKELKNVNNKHEGLKTNSKMKYSKRIKPDKQTGNKRRSGALEVHINKMRWEDSNSSVFETNRWQNHIMQTKGVINISLFLRQKILTYSDILLVEVSLHLYLSLLQEKKQKNKTITILKPTMLSIHNNRQS